MCGTTHDKTRTTIPIVEDHWPETEKKHPQSEEEKSMRTDLHGHKLTSQNHESKRL